jgi:xanthine dehydrogenase accessory factor
MHAADLRVLFLGCGDLGTGAAHALYRAGVALAIVELASPTAVRRRVAFAEAARLGEVEVEGVRCRRVELSTLQRTPAEFVPLCVAPVDAVLTEFAPHAFVDARVTKRPLELQLPSGLFRIALGPGHIAGDDCDAVIETLRGPDLGRVIWQGQAAPDTGVPGELGGETALRVLHAPAGGRLALHVQIGARVAAGAQVANVDGVPVRTAIAGLVRGLLADGVTVVAGQKLGDVDPRPDPPPADRITDKAHAIGAGVRTALATRFGIAL